MKIYKLDQLLESTHDRQYSVESGAVRILYGTLAPREKARPISAPEGFDQIVHIIKGAAELRHGNTTFCASAGEAFIATEPVYIENNGDREVVYIAACGRSPSGVPCAGGEEVKGSVAAVTPPLEENEQERGGEEQE
ncbi:MAG: hypothetical protein ACE5EB_03090 [Thermodesulfobacteriota bacterium]